MQMYRREGRGLCLISPFRLATPALMDMLHVTGCSQHQAYSPARIKFPFYPMTAALELSMIT